MKITNVEAIVLESPYEYNTPEDETEAHGVKYCLLIKLTTDEGIIGWSDVETAPHIGAAAVNAPRQRTGHVRRFAIARGGRRPFRRRATLGQDLPRQHLLRPAGSGHPSVVRV